MKDYFGYSVSDEDYDFIKGMTDYAETYFGFGIASSEYRIYLEPIEDHLEIFVEGRLVAKYSCVKEFLLNFGINEKKLIELIGDFNFA